MKPVFVATVDKQIESEVRTIHDEFEGRLTDHSIAVVAAVTFDGVVADPASRELYLADGANNNVDVVDVSTATPQFVRALDVTTAPHGLAIAPDTHLLYVGLTGGEVAVIDTQYGSPRDLQVVTRIVADTPEVDRLAYTDHTKPVVASRCPGR